jgi:hypothetical protein
MSKHERFYAALGSVALNIAVGLVLVQSAGAAVPASDEPQAQPRHHVIQLNVEARATHENCAMRRRDRAIAAVLLALMV